MDMNCCPSCRSACMDPWHYEAAMEDENEQNEDPCGCVPYRRIPATPPGN